MLQRNKKEKHFYVRFDEIGLRSRPSFRKNILAQKWHVPSVLLPPHAASSAVMELQTKLGAHPLYRSPYHSPPVPARRFAILPSCDLVERKLAFSFYVSLATGRPPLEYRTYTRFIHKSCKSHCSVYRYASFLQCSTVPPIYPPARRFVRSLPQHDGTKVRV